MILRYQITIKQSNQHGGFEATVDRPGERVGVSTSPSLLAALSYAVEAVEEAEALSDEVERGS